MKPAASSQHRTDCDLLAILDQGVCSNPMRPALRSGSRGDTTFAALRQRAEDLSACWTGFGLVAGVRVATVLSNRPSTSLALLTLAANATAVPFNPGSPVAELVRDMELSQVHAIVTDDDGLVIARQAAHQLALPLFLIETRPGETTGVFQVRRLWGDKPPQAAPDGHDVALVLRTSGSTGDPKRVPLTPRNLLQSAENVARSLALTDHDIGLAMMPMFHIGGIVDLLMAPLSAGGCVAFADAISIPALLDGLKRFQPTWFQCVPTVLRDLMATDLEPSNRRAFQSLRFIRVVSQALPPALQRDFETRFDTRLVPIFGMTETTGLIASPSIDRGPAKVGSVGQPIGCDVKISDAFGNALAPGREGEVLIAGPTLMRGYEASSDTNTFRGVFLRSGDHGYLDEEGDLFITGRLKDIINRGGEKISPQEVDLALATLPGVRDAAAFAVPHASLGEDVAAAVVPNTGIALDADALRLKLRDCLAAHKIPRNIYILDALPRLPSGKLDRRALPPLTARSGHGDAGGETAVSALGAVLRGAWGSVLGAPPDHRDTDFFAAGGDSLSATTLLLALEKHLGTSIPGSALFDIPTLRGMEEALTELSGLRDADDLDVQTRASLDALSAGWRGRHGNGQSLIFGRDTLAQGRPLFWVCQGMHEFENFRQGLTEARPIYAMPSLSNTALKTTRTRLNLAQYYAAQVQAIQPEGPVLVGGFCEGGAVAFEMVKSLRARGREIGLLVLHDRFVAEPYDGPVAIFCSKRGPYSPYEQSNAPERSWSKFYTGPLAVIHSGTDHHDAHEPPYAARFARQLHQELVRAEAEVSSDRERRNPHALTVDPRAKQAVVQARVPRFARQGTRLTLRVSVTNVSSITWAPTSESGLVLVGCWRTQDTYTTVLHAGCCTLERPIAPHETTVFDLAVVVPTRSLPLRLEIDMAEDGLSSFSGGGSALFTRPVIPLPGLHKRGLRSESLTWI